MMGSLLIVADDEPRIEDVPLPSGDIRIVGGDQLAVEGDRDMCVERPGLKAATVVMKDNEFEPPRIEIEVGESVVWSNKGGDTHTATANDSSFNTGDVLPGDSSKPIKFDTPGEFKYQCLHHTMSGIVVVKSSARAKKNEF
jgi:plastocyanin